MRVKGLKSISRRWLSSLRISEELKQALHENKPIVSLESTIITHGLPYPENLSMAQRVEKEIRRNGAIPATTAFIGGIPKVGLTETELESLAESKIATKVSRRDIPYVISQKLNGGTTISGTMILSERAGIKVFATGGLGGVHRDGENTLDISADLDELGKTSVAVVCAGPKSILDIERTMEYLETKGVFVGTLGPDGTNIPGFYTRDSGVASPYNFQNFKQAADIIKQGDLLNLNNGYLFCIPPPEDVALDSRFISEVINQANEEAIKLGIKGKRLTPFLLSKIATATNGRSVKSNIEFVLNNARSATKIAIEYGKLNEINSGGFQPFIQTPSNQEANVSNVNMNELKPVVSMVIGSVALDTYCSVNSPIVFEDSNPSKIRCSLGGVGYNVALESLENGNKSLKFVSIVGDDVQGQAVMNTLKTKNNSIKVLKDGTTSQYISLHGAEGELVIAAADMNIIETLPLDYVEKEIRGSKPNFILFDANIKSEIMNKIIELSQELKFKIAFEPTSSPKSKKLSQTILSCYPNSSIELSTPTFKELECMYKSFEDAGKFELDNWFPVIDHLGVDNSLRIKLEGASLKDPFYKKVLYDGIFQAAVSLLPFIRTLVIKDGSNGVLLLSIHENIDQVQTNPKAKLSLKSNGQKFGVLFEHYEVPDIVEKVANVTGAGDALAGALFTFISSDPEVLRSEKRGDIIEKAQRAAANKLLSNNV